MKWWVPASSASDSSTTPCSAQGAMPIELLRAVLMGTALPKDAKPSWRFAK